MYLEQQGIVNINWDKINVAYNGVLSTVTNTIANSSTASGGVGGSHATLTTASSLLPATTMMMTNFGIPLTGSIATGFAIGILKG
jgi:pheromone shutdown protein TraB